MYLFVFPVISHREPLFPQRAKSLQNSWNIVIATVMVTREIGAAGTACRVMSTGRGNK